jgi:hypothetical protein
LDLTTGALVAKGVFERIVEFRVLSGLKTVDSLYLILFIDIVSSAHFVQRHRNADLQPSLTDFFEKVRAVGCCRCFSAENRGASLHAKHFTSFSMVSMKPDRSTV